MNNLYGRAMNQCLPVGNYEWKNILSFETEMKMMMTDVFLSV